MYPQDDDIDRESVYSQFCSSAGGDSGVVFQNTQRVNMTDDLFHTDVTLNDTVQVRALLDSGSMACSLSARLLPVLENSGIVTPESVSPTSIVLIGCGGLKTSPVGTCELRMSVFDCQISVPTFIVEGQTDDLILGSNIIKHFIRVLKTSGDFWERMSPSNDSKILVAVASQRGSLEGWGSS